MYVLSKAMKISIQKMLQDLATHLKLSFYPGRKIAGDKLAREQKRSRLLRILCNVFESY